ncbi:MAG TPA: N-acetylmuramoyl-L-alanine amidase [Thermomicrobiales bacterium]|nr:N-acetylmuramoyl-L-alanine amidase [Thermomicrobiales bacterium]
MSARSERLATARARPSRRGVDARAPFDARAGDALADALTDLPGVSGRRLTEDERRLLTERYRRREGIVAEAPAAPRPPATSGRPKSAPRMPRRRRQSTVRSRGIVALGAVLLTGLVILVLAGGRLFGAPGRFDGDAGATDLPAAAFPAPQASPPGFAAIESTPAATAPIAALNARAPIVCLDPGHGGSDRGFMRPPFGVLPSMNEADMALRLAWDLESRLKRDGLTVVMTRRTDVSVAGDDEDVNHDGKTARDDPAGTDHYGTIDDIQARIDICNAAHADLLVSMHINGYSTDKPFGYETWYTAARPFGDLSRAFATLAYAHLKEQLAKIGYVVPPALERGVNDDSTADVQKQYSIYKHFLITGPEIPHELTPSAMPGAIVETLFISNDNDAMVLASDQGRNAIVTAYENAILEYFRRYPPKPAGG